MPKELEGAIRSALKEAGESGKKNVKQLINRGGYGTYRAVDTGFMRDTIRMRVSGDKVIVESSPKADYAIYVHESTWKMKPARPFMEAAKNKYEATGELERIFKKYLDKL